MSPTKRIQLALFLTAIVALMTSQATALSGPKSPIRDYCIPDLPVPYFCTNTTLRATLRGNQILPDLIGAMKYQVGVKVGYPGRLDVVGTYVNKTLAAVVPTITFSEVVDLYTLVMLDPDASARWNATNAPILHWLVTNIPGGNVTAGTTVAPYRPPGPAFGNGLHRYTQLVMGQRGRTLNVAPIDTSNPAARRNFDIEKFIRDNGLAVLGGSFFLSQF